MGSSLVWGWCKQSHTPAVVWNYFKIELIYFFPMFFLDDVWLLLIGFWDVRTWTFLSWLFDQNSLRPFQYYAVSWTCAVLDIGSQWSWVIISKRYFTVSGKGKSVYVLNNYIWSPSKTKLINSAFQLSPCNYMKWIYVLLCGFNRLHDESSVSLCHFGQYCNVITNMHCSRTDCFQKQSLS